MSNTDIHLSGPHIDRKRDTFTWTGTIDPDSDEPKDVVIMMRFKTGSLAGEGDGGYREDAKDALKQVAIEIIKGKLIG